MPVMTDVALAVADAARRLAGDVHGDGHCDAERPQPHAAFFADATNTMSKR
jgi:hypothetical protein